MRLETQPPIATARSKSRLQRPGASPAFGGRCGFRGIAALPSYRHGRGDPGIPSPVPPHLRLETEKRKRRGCCIRRPPAPRGPLTTPHEHSPPGLDRTLSLFPHVAHQTVGNLPQASKALKGNGESEAGGRGVTCPLAQASRTCRETPGGGGSASAIVETPSRLPRGYGAVRAENFTEWLSPFGAVSTTACPRAMAHASGLDDRPSRTSCRAVTTGDAGAGSRTARRGRHAVPGGMSPVRPFLNAGSSVPGGDRAPNPPRPGAENGLYVSDALRSRES